MNLSRSALSACVIAGLANAREYSYLGKARDLGQGERNIWTRLPFVANASKEMIKAPSVTSPSPSLTQRVFIHIYDALEFDRLALYYRPFLRESLYFRCEGIIGRDSVRVFTFLRSAINCKSRFEENYRSLQFCIYFIILGSDR